MEGFSDTYYRAKRTTLVWSAGFAIVMTLPIELRSGGFLNFINISTVDVRLLQWGMGVAATYYVLVFLFSHITERPSWKSDIDSGIANIEKISTRISAGATAMAKHAEEFDSRAKEIQKSADKFRGEFNKEWRQYRGENLENNFVSVVTSPDSILRNNLRAVVKEEMALWEKSLPQELRKARSEKFAGELVEAGVLGIIESVEAVTDGLGMKINSILNQHDKFLTKWFAQAAGRHEQLSASIEAIVASDKERWRKVSSWRNYWNIRVNIIDLAAPILVYSVAMLTIVLNLRGDLPLQYEVDVLEHVDITFIEEPPSDEADRGSNN